MIYLIIYFISVLVVLIYFVGSELDKEALRDYRGLPHTPKLKEEKKQFKFGR